MAEYIQKTDPKLIPKKKLYTGAEIPVIGLGTFGSDNYDNDTIAAAVYEAILFGYRHIDCAAVYGNEKEIGKVLKKAISEGIVKREDLWITSKVWNDMHHDVAGACKRTLEDLELDYLDLYLIHWPFPNFHAKGVDVSSRDPHAVPYIHENYMNTWRSMEKLVDEGLVRNIGTSNMTRAKMELLLRDCCIRPVCNEMELHPHFQQPELYNYMVSENIQPIGFCPIGSPNRPERDKTPQDTVPIEDPVIKGIADKYGVHPAVICIKWAVQRGEVVIPFSVKSEKIAANLQCTVNITLTEQEMKSIENTDKNCRFIKGQVFTWQGASWQDLWDENDKMKAAYLPGNSTVIFKEVDIPVPGHGEVLIKMKSSTICGSDIRAIYREHLGKGPEGYQDKICGHEPSGQIIKAGPGLRRFKEGDRVIIYHISGCGVCNDCRRGYMISCTSKYRRAYGWQRDGGMAEYMLAEEKDLVALPDSLSYTDGAQIACGFGTVYEGIEKIGISGNDTVLVTGLGPVGLAACMLAKAMGADRVIGVDTVKERMEIAVSKGLADYVLLSDNKALDKIKEITGGNGAEKSIECSGHTLGRQLAIRATRKWGSIVFIGEGGTVEFNPSPDIIHEQKNIYGSWVTNIWRMEELVERIVRWKIHPEDLVTHRFTLDKAGDAFALMAEGKCGKVAVVFDEEIREY